MKKIKMIKSLSIECTEQIMEVCCMRPTVYIIQPYIIQLLEDGSLSLILLNNP